MTPPVFVDTDVVLDLLARRDPFYPAAARLFSLAERGAVRLCVSSLAYANLYYILRKGRTAAGATAILKKFSKLITILPVDAEIVAAALDAGFSDFEDALQYHAALRVGATSLITRNARDFRRAAMNVCSPEEFLARRKLI